MSITKKLTQFIREYNCKLNHPSPPPPSPLPPPPSILDVLNQDHSFCFRMLDVPVNATTDAAAHIHSLVKMAEPVSSSAKTSHESSNANAARDSLDEFVGSLCRALRIVHSLFHTPTLYELPTTAD